MNLAKFADTLEAELNASIKIESNKVLIYEGTINKVVKNLIKNIAQENSIKVDVKVIPKYNKYKIIIKNEIKPREELISAARELGRRAFEEEQKLQDNPFNKNTKSFKDWENGFIEAIDFL